MEKVTKDFITDYVERNVLLWIEELDNITEQREVIKELEKIIENFKYEIEDYVCEHGNKDYQCQNINCDVKFCIDCIENNPSVQRICAPHCYSIGYCSCLTRKTYCTCSTKCLRIVKETGKSRRYS